MSRLPQEDREGLLRDLSQMGSAGRAEGESGERFRQTFYPVAEHARAFDPDVVLIVGERGAGKSELFRAAVEFDLLPAIVRSVTSTRLGKLDLGKTAWLAAHPIGSDFPNPMGLRRFFSEHGQDTEAGMQFWFAYLVRVLGSRLSGPPALTGSAFFAAPGADVQPIFGMFRDLGSQPLIALDQLDKELQSRDEWIFVSYDELDILGAYDWDAMARSIHGLVAFWANHARRWLRVRAKIFLRSDLFRRHAQSFGAELVKLAANRAEITWSDRNLYAMLVKRIANTSDALQRYCEQSRLDFQRDNDLGLVPEIERASDAQPLIERLAGPYMGANYKKGRTFPWLLSHVRDGNGHAMPRALVRLIEEAAQEELERPRATHNRLLDPRSLRRALDKVSKEHVFTANTHELPWLPGVAHRLRGQGVPMERRDAERLLRRDWDGVWNESNVGLHPPALDPRALVDYMVDIGVFRTRPDGRIDAPDLFLAGLGLTRKGGVRKR